MGYFSSGTEGMDYQSKYCFKCSHYEDDCSVWLLHLNFVSKSNKHPLIREILDELIPMTDNGVWNKQCSMYVEREESA